MMRKKLVAGLIALNVLIGLTLFVTPVGTQVLLNLGLRSCCQGQSGGTQYCCDDCCWFYSDCDNDGDCEA